MTKVLYSQSTQQIKPYPRIDNEPVIGLNPDYLVLTQIDTAPPFIESHQKLISNYNINLNTLEYIQVWEIVDLPNLTGIRDEISYGNRYPLVQTWYDQLLPRQRDPLQIAIGNRDLEEIERCLFLILPTDEETLNELVTLLTEFNVPINLPV